VLILVVVLVLECGIGVESILQTSLRKVFVPKGRVGLIPKR
jgi:hypothetical protein